LISHAASAFPHSKLSACTRIAHIYSTRLPFTNYSSTKCVYSVNISDLLTSSKVCNVQEWTNSNVSAE